MMLSMDRLGELSPEQQGKMERLASRLEQFGSVIVAFSAGVDSTFMAAMACHVLGDRALAVTATSPSFPERELDEAIALAKTIGIRHRVIRSNELANPDYANNPMSRCYHCKTELYGLLREQISEEEGIEHVVDGTNVDDLGDFRPGRKAAREQRVESPLAELNFSKEDIRAASRALDLATADKPAFACMASRFPYGEQITEEGLRRVERAENALRDIGFGQLRVRVHGGDTARIEFHPSELQRAQTEPQKTRIMDLVKSCGYASVSIDSEGYRRGSLNEAFQRPRMNV